jgi:hypothetical protein
MSSEPTNKVRMSRRLLAASTGAASQVLAIVLVSLIWRHSAGKWGLAAWTLYFVGFCAIVPVVGVLFARRIGHCDANALQFAKSAAVIGLCNGVFAISALGLEEGGVPLVVYVSGYGLLLLGLFARLVRQ